MQCVLVKGASGSGKSTLAQQLSQRLHIPYVELDALHHGPNWTPASAQSLRARLADRLDDSRGWVVDGNYDSKLGALLLDRAQLIVWLDLPLPLKLARLARRSAARWWRQESLWNGNRETLRGLFWGREALFPWAVRTHFDQRENWPHMLSAGKTMRLTTAHAVERWLATFHEEAQHAARNPRLRTP